jgi:hypothetical protein
MELIFVLINQNFREVMHILSLLIYIFGIKIYSNFSAETNTGNYINIELRNLCRHRL